MYKKTFISIFMILSLIFSLALSVSAAHKHTYEYIPCGSDTQHIKRCTTCNDVLTYESHGARYQCLTPCGSCGYTYSTPKSHTYDTWQSLNNEYGNEKHQLICSVYWFYGRCGAVKPGSITPCTPIGTTWITSIAENGYHDEFKDCAYCEVGIYQGKVSCFKALGNSTCMYCEGAGLRD